jgi:hypothetical protein
MMQTYWKLSVVMFVACAVFGVACLSCKKVTDGESIPIAELDIKNLLSAVEQYENQYHHLPIVDLGIERQSNSKVASVLTARFDQALVVNINSNKIEFLKWPTNRMGNGQMLDPWNTPYNFAFRVDGSAIFKVNTNVVNGDVAIWSNGPNRKDEGGGGDDIASWRIKRR